MRHHLQARSVKSAGEMRRSKTWYGGGATVAFASMVLTILSGIAAGPTTFGLAALVGAILLPAPAHAQSGSTAAGTVPGQFSVTPAGGASYSIPLDLPPGIAGLAPSLSIQYSNSTPYTYMGAGFSIGGLSQISRCPKTLADDGVWQGVTGSADDFCLDGQKLVAAGDGTYRTQIDSFQQVTLNGSTTNPTFFTVKSKSGLTMTYGSVATLSGADAGGVYTGASTASANQTTVNYIWLLGQVEDSTGNYMLFKYTINQDAVYAGTADINYLISEIDYSGNVAAGVSPFVTVNFNYLPNTSVVNVNADRNGFVGGAYFHWDQLLTSITANVSGQGVVRTWNIGYSTDPARLGTAIVNSIDECGSDGSCFPETAFNYVDNVTATAQNASINLNIALDSSYTLFPADLDNDGHADLLAMKWTSGNTAYVSVIDDPGLGHAATAPVAWSLPANTSKALPVVGDFNRDGITDAAFVIIAGCNLYIEYALGAGNGTLTSPTTVELGNSGYVNNQCPSSNLPPSVFSITEAHYGDFAGAGYGGILLVNDNDSTNAGEYIYERQVVQFSSSGVSAQAVEVDGVVYTESFTTLTGDMNGDGITDVVVVSNSSYEVSICPGAQNCVSQGTLSQLKTGQFASYLWSAELADINGDGTPDLVMLTESGLPTPTNPTDGYLFFGLDFLGDGLGHLITSAYNGYYTGNIPAAWSPVFGDFDGDGVTDIGFYSVGSTTYRTYIAQNNGDGYNGNSNNGNPNGTLNGLNWNTTTAVAADIYGNGHSDIVALAPGSSNSQLGDSALVQTGSASALHSPGLLSTLTNGFGAQIDLGWSRLTDYTNYSPVNDANTSAFPNSHAPGDTSLWSYPNRIFHQPLFLVSAQSNWQTADTQSCTLYCPASRTVNYKYAGARTNVQGRGFLGFAETVALDSATSMQEVTDIRQDFPYTGMTSQTVAETSANVIEEQSNVSYSMVNTCTSGQLVYNTISSTTVDVHAEVTAPNDPAVSDTETTSNFNCYGELTSNQVTTFAGNISNPPHYVTSTSNTYNADNVDSWQLGRMDSTSVTRTNADGSSDSRYSTFGYDSNTGLLVTEKIWGRSASDTSHWTQTSYQRDGLGNIQTTTVSGPDIVSRATTNTFPTSAPNYGRFSSQTCNPLQQCVQRSYDAAGDILGTTDANGIATTFSVDGFGRSTGSTTTATGLSLSTTIARKLCSAATNGQCTSASGALLYPYFYTETTKNDGSDAVIVYDAWERPLRKAAVNGAGAWVETLTQYDFASRPMEVSSPRFASSSGTVYWTSTVYDPVGRPSLVLAPLNQSILNDNGVNYAYGIDSSTGFASVRVTDGLGKTATRLTDPLGRVARTIDNDGNAVNFGYDPFDNLVSITDPAGRQTSMIYDSRGHKTSMSDPAMGAWSYTPDTLGEVLSQTDANGNTVATIYDVLGRKLSRTAPDFSYAWAWDQSPNGSQTWKGALFDAQKTQNGGGLIYDHAYTYTPFGAVNTSQETISGNAYTTSYGYDSVGRVNAMNYPNGLALGIGYSEYGAENSIRQVGGQIFWATASWDQWGKISQEQLGNGVSNSITRDAAVGVIQTISATPPSGANGGNPIASLIYGWDIDHNITQRSNNATGQSEALTYDNENRLTADTVTNPTPPAATIAVGNFDPIGNTPSRSGPPATLYGNRSYGWTKQNQLDQVSDSFLGQVSFLYGSGGGLVSQTSTPAGASATTTQFIGNGLAEHSVSGSSSVWDDYIATPSGTLVLAVQSGSQPNVLEYLQQDNQGSTVALSDNSGNLIQQYAYDPYGRRSVSYTAPAYSGIQTDLGYIGHRQIDFLNLVHMRGRVYDPSLSRFLSADPNLQSPGNAQSLNRYAYVWNNPLTFTDPSGYFLSGFTSWFGHNWRTFAGVAVAALAAYLGVEYDIGPTAALAGGFVSGVVSGNGSLQSGLVGAEFGILNFGIGAGLGEVSASGVLDGNQVPSFVQKIVAHGFVGAIQATYSGQNLGSGFLAGAAQASAAPFITGPLPFRVTEAAAIGGTASVIGGGKFANGAITGAFAQAFNDSLGKGIDVESDASGVNAAMRSFSNWAASNPVQAATLALNFIPVVDLFVDAGLAVDAAEGELTAAQQLAVNRAAGAAFEQSVGAGLEGSGLTVGQQISIQTESGVTTRLDFLTQDPVTGEIGCIECKASPTAPLTPNQTLGFPEIEQSGGTILGAGKPGFPGGMQIPPTAVQIIRGP